MSWDDFVDDVSNGWNSAVDDVGNALSDAGSSISNAFDQFSNEISSAIDSADGPFGALFGVLGALVGGIADLAAGVVQAACDVAGGLVAGIIDLGAGFIGGIVGGKAGRAIVAAGHVAADATYNVFHTGGRLLAGFIQSLGALGKALFNGLRCTGGWLLDMPFTAFSPTRRTVTPEQLARIDHFFVLMLENRSFDHMFGYSGIPGIATVRGNERHFPNAVQGGPTTATYYPAAGATDTVNKDPGHEFRDVNQQLDFNPNTGQPRLTGFSADYLINGAAVPDLASVVRCFGADQLPVLNQLAREFVLCDHWFASLPGPTWPNRFFVHAGTSGGLADSPASAILGAAAALGPTFGQAIAIGEYTFENGTIFDRLDARCIPWRIYHDDPIPQVLAIAGMTYRYQYTTNFSPFFNFATDLGQAYDAAYTFIEPSYGLGIVDDYADLGNSMHPLCGVGAGERLVKQVYEAIRNSPLWERSALIITFDEHGGFFDSVVPPIAVPPGDDRRNAEDGSEESRTFQFDRLGLRVPALVISPWVRTGQVDPTPYDHTSILASLEKRFGLKPLTERDAAATSLAPLFSNEEPRADAPTVLDNPALP